MREERVTINILDWLEKNEWKIVCYDFPQSGTGLMLHPNSIVNRNTKNKGSIIPDIIATRNAIAIFFENKDRFVLSDFEKIKEIKSSGNYSDSLNSLLGTFNVSKIYFGIGIPANERDIEKSIENISGIDFLVTTSEDKTVFVNFDEFGILS